MKASSTALSVLGTLAVAGYLVATEWPFWERWTKKSNPSAQRQPRLKKRTKKSDRSKLRDKAGKAAVAKKDEPTPDKKYRSGSLIYWVDKICDCQAGSEFVLETVELTPSKTILTILNARLQEVTAYPPGHETAQYLLESRYVGQKRPRHDLEELREIGEFPSKTTPVSFQMVFPRVADETLTFSLTGRATRKLDYFNFSTIPLEKPITPEEADNRAAFRRCGFSGPTTIPSGQKKLFTAHRHSRISGFKWTATSGISIEGSSHKNKVEVTGDQGAEGKLCLDARVDGESCHYCQTVEVGPPQDLDIDFEMTKCRGLPSTEPHWQFTVLQPKRASYSWSTEPGNIVRGSHHKSTAIMRPNLRPGVFEVTLEVTKDGQKSSHTRAFHNVYSCLEPF